jgi:hypothetical protein
MTNDRAGFTREEGGESPRRNQQGALGGSQSGGQHTDDRDGGRGPDELQGSRDQASGRRHEENLATRGESDVEDRQDRDTGSST